MTRLTLQIQHADQPLRAPRAWYLAGSDAAVWLQEIARWATPHAKLLAAPIPRSFSDASLRGALFVPVKAEVRGVSARCLPYGLIGERLYLPVAARLVPEIDAAELRRLLDPQYDYVWHPLVGLIAFAAEDMLSVAQLISLGPPQSTAWSAARPGVAFPNRLLSLSADVEQTIEQLLRQGRDDIGDQANSLDHLPPSDREPQPGMINAVRRQGARAAANVVKWLTEGAASAAGAAAGSAAGGPSWLENWRRWANESLAQLSAETEAARNREVARLMDLLQHDPDRGLQFALPLTGDAHRGRAPAGGQLGRRNVDFNLSNLGGGQAADPWELPHEYYQQLRARYIDLAGREQRLGRYRRAAYIWAELLGDYQAAAGVLTAGGHWREAAALYQKRLNQPVEAARCLEGGGLWSEAIAIYDEQQMHEKAGDLLVQLEQWDEAHMRYEAALSVHRAAHDVVAASHLLEGKLERPHDALTELAHGWPDSPQALACLRRVFELAGKLGAHEEARRWTEELREQLIRNRHTYRGTVDVLAEASQSYPEAKLRQQAADTSRVLIARALPGASVSEVQTLVASLTKLAPGDRLLRRDGQRYVDSLHTSRRVPPTPKRNEARKVATFQLPVDVDWLSFITCGNMIFAAGFGGDEGERLVISRVSWEGNLELCNSAWWPRPKSDQGLLMCIAPHRDPELVIHLVGQPSLLPQRAFVDVPKSGETVSLGDAAFAGGAAGITEATLALSRATADRTWVVKRFEGSFYLYCLSTTGQNLCGVPLSELDADASESLDLAIRLHATSASVYVAMGTCLLAIDQQQQKHLLELPRPVHQLSGTAPHTVGRVVAALDHGAVVIWEGPELHHCRIADDIGDCPVAGFNRRGLLTVVSRQGGEIYRTANQQAEFLAKLPPQPATPLAVLSPPHVRQVAVALADGRIEVYEVA